MKEIIISIGQWATRGVPNFLGFIFVLAIVLFYVEKIYNDTLSFFKGVLTRRPRNNFFISEKNVDKKFIEELRKFYGDKERKPE